jgi:hypothetical protein
MQDFKNYSSSKSESDKGFSPNNNSDLISMITNIAKNYDGKSEDELLRAIYFEAEKSRKKGTLTDSDIDNFTAMLAPILDDKKRKKLYDIANKLKRKRI